MGKGDFGTRYRFHKSTIGHAHHNMMTSSIEKNGGRSSVKNNALMFSFQKDQSQTSNNPGQHKLKLSSNLSKGQGQVQDLKITGQRRVDTHIEGPHKSAFSNLKEVSLKSRDLKK